MLDILTGLGAFFFWDTLLRVLSEMVGTIDIQPYPTIDIVATSERLGMYFLPDKCGSISIPKIFLGKHIE